MFKLDSTGSTLLYSSYIGGLSQDQGRAITVDSKGDLYVAAATTSSGLPTTPGALQPALAGDFDIFILKLSFNRPPVAEAGPDQTVECTGYSGANVTLDGSASSDPDNDPLTYEWRDADGNLVGSTAQVMLTLSRGTHDFTLSVNDGRGGTNSDTVGIVVRDTTAPTLTLTKASTTEVLPSAAAAGAAVDVLAASGSAASDVCDPSPVITHNGLPLYPIGTTQVTITATDNCGNYSQKPFTVQVVYNFFGFLPPVRNDGSSVFNAGRTVPVKFQLTAADGTVIRNAVATLQVFEINGEEIFPESSGASNTGNLFRFGDQYIYNLSTKGYTLGSYLLRVSLNDQTKHEVWVSLR
jgi:hypothetical protein